MTTNITETPPAALEGRTSSAAAKASDERLRIATESTSSAIASAHRNDDRPRPSLKAVVSGRALELWEPVIKRTLRGHQRALGALTVPESADPTARIVKEMRASGAAGEPVDPDGAHVAALTEFHRARNDADAMSAARHEVTRQTARALTDDIAGMRRELLSAVAADLRDVAADAEQIAPALDGVTTADEAITRGVVSAWKSRADIAERTLDVANALHWVRRRCDRGFIVDATSRPDAWPVGNDHRHTSAETWAVVDDILDRLEVTDAARRLMTGEA
ncbi:hypothetical protein RND64_20215 [Gordonia sp. w5E2]|uniref:hypothetical protein n=1 Tax=Gordonia sp. w5E2 TaxID=3075837 RepID=UPI002F4103CB